jgi:hypothetical protein
VQAKLWEFACLRFAVGKPFGAAEAARLAECDRDYVKRYYRWLWQSAYLAMITRGRAGAPLYQVVGGKEHEAAPAWNRRAEKRKSVGQAPSPVVLFPPAAPSPQPSPTRGEGVKCTCHPTMSYGHVECPVHGKGGDKDHRRDACATRLDAALEDFGRALVEVTGSIGRAWEIIREMKGELFALAAEEQGHDEPGEPTDGHH